MTANIADASWLNLIPAGRVSGNQQGDSQEETWYQGDGETKIVTECDI